MLLIMKFRKDLLYKINIVLIIVTNFFLNTFVLIEFSLKADLFIAGLL